MVTYARLWVFLLACIFTLPLSAGNILPNYSFENGTGGPCSTTTFLADCPATSWDIVSNTGILTGAELLPTTLPIISAGSNMLHIQAGGAYGGVFTTLPTDTYYDGVWVYALSGVAGIALIPSSWTGSFDGQTTVLNQWQFIQSTSPVTSSELVIYSVGGPADFYLDLAAVDTNPIIPDQFDAPEPSTASLALLALGGGLLVVSRRRTSRR